MIQWLAASVRHAPAVYYYTFENPLLLEVRVHVHVLRLCSHVFLLRPSPSSGCLLVSFFFIEPLLNHLNCGICTSIVCRSTWYKDELLTDVASPVSALQLGELCRQLRERETTVGQLMQLLVNYCQQKQDGRQHLSLMDYLKRASIEK